jgi:hypothetical protein
MSKTSNRKQGRGPEFLVRPPFSSKCKYLHHFNEGLKLQVIIKIDLATFQFKLKFDVLGTWGDDCTGHLESLIDCMPLLR